MTECQVGFLDSNPVPKLTLQKPVTANSLLLCQMMENSKLAALCSALRTINSALVHEQVTPLDGGSTSATHCCCTHRQSTAISAKRERKNSTPKAMAIFWTASAGSRNESQLE